ncbi:MAG: 50S ribosomal protein L11 methyltransferase [Pseudomonadota bacterium]
MYKLTWTGSRSAMEAGAAYLSEVLDPPADAVGLLRLAEDIDDGAPSVEDAAPADDASAWSLDAYFQDDTDIDALTEDIAAFDEAFRDAQAENSERLPDQDWVAHSLEGLGIVEAGAFLLYGVHDADKVGDASDVIPIRIDANQAFGTGHHPTTAGCLSLLSRFAGAPPGEVLDLGCGSGVLAIAAAKLWDADVLAIDIDETSVTIAKENAHLNDVGAKINFVAGDGFDHTAVKETGPFDFIFANILAGPLVELAPAMAQHIAPLGRVMLAGLLKDQEADIDAAYKAQGFKRINRLDHAAWPVLLYVKP